MIMTGVILLTAASMIAADNIYKASWARMKVSIAVATLGIGLLAAGLI